MKKIWLLSLCCALFLIGCHQVQRTYSKDSNGITITSTDEDGTTSTETFADPTVKSLTDKGLNEHQAVSLISNGEVATSTSSELTAFGWFVIITIIVIIIIAMLASGNGKEAAELIGDIADLAD